MRLRKCDNINGCGKIYDHRYDSCIYCESPKWASDVMTNYDVRDWIYDIESYPTLFSCLAYHPASDRWWSFEVSTRVNQWDYFLQWFDYLSKRSCRMIGFNNINYDYPVIHQAIKTGANNPLKIYNINQSIINSGWNTYTAISDDETFVQQIDLFKIHHFDNKARRTSLKQVEFAQRARNLADLPYSPGYMLAPSQIDEVLEYNKNDVIETFNFYKSSLEKIEFREDLSREYERNFLNFSDAKIGSEIMATELKQSGAKLWQNGEKIQTHREFIRLEEAIFPYIHLEHPELQRVKDWLSKQVIQETKGVFNELNATVQGFTFYFGTGGLHGSIESQRLEATPERMILDLDVTSYYPSMGIVNRIYPEHLSNVFCDVQTDILERRKQYKKGTMQNAAYKLALNAGFGNSNNKYSHFYDPLYTMTITINGQLLLCMLAEQMLKIPTLRLIQANTDGITIEFNRSYKQQVQDVVNWWQQYTQLQLEKMEYSRMFIRDVNNYIAESIDGKIKRKGAYEYERGYHQNHSKLIVPKAVEAYALHGVDCEYYIKMHKNPYDFMIMGKVDRSSNIFLDDIKQQRTCRYYVSKTGGVLRAHRPPKGEEGAYKRKNGISDEYYNEILNQIDPGMHDERIHTKNKSVYKTRVEELERGFLCSMCNRVEDFNFTNLNYNYYIAEAKKLIAWL